MSTIYLANNLHYKPQDYKIRGFKTDYIFCSESIEEIETPQEDDFIVFEKNENFFQTEIIYKEKINKKRFIQSFPKDSDQFDNIFNYLSNNAFDIESLQSFCTKYNLRFKEIEWLEEDLIERMGFPSSSLFNRKNKEIFEFYILLYKNKHHKMSKNNLYLDLKKISSEQKDLILKWLKSFEIDYSEERLLYIDSPALLDLINNLFIKVLPSFTKESFKEFVSILYKVYNNEEIQMPHNIQLKLCYMILNLVEESFPIVPYYTGKKGLWLTTLEEDSKSIEQDFVLLDKDLLIRVIDYKE